MRQWFSPTINATTSRNSQERSWWRCGILLAGRLGCQTDLSEMASRAVFLLHFQSTSDRHPQVIEQRLCRSGTTSQNKIHLGLNFARNGDRTGWSLSTLYPQGSWRPTPGRLKRANQMNVGSWSWRTKDRRNCGAKQCGCYRPT